MDRKQEGGRGGAFLGASVGHSISRLTSMLKLYFLLSVSRMLGVELMMITNLDFESKVLSSFRIFAFKASSHGITGQSD